VSKGITGVRVGKVKRTFHRTADNLPDTRIPGYVILNRQRVDGFLEVRGDGFYFVTKATTL